MSIEIRQQVESLRERIESLKGERDEIANAPLPQAEVISRAHAMIEAKAARFVEDDLRYRLSDLVNASGNPHGSSLFKLSFFTLKDIDQSHDLDLGGLLCCLLGDPIREGLSKAIQGLAYEAGLPAAMRPAKIKELDSEITKLERAEESMIMTAKEMGQTIARHPDADPRVILEVAA